VFPGKYKPGYVRIIHGEFFTISVLESVLAKKAGSLGSLDKTLVTVNKKQKNHPQKSAIKT